MNNKLKFLCISDSTFVQSALQETLLGSESELVIAPTIRDALLLLPKLQPDLVFLSRVVQRSDGLELLRKLQVSGILRETPVIFLTNWEVHVDEALRAGADDYLMLPCSELQIRHRIEQVLQRRQTCRTSEQTEHHSFREKAILFQSV